MGQYTLDKFGFFNGIFGIEQANWAEYWKGVIPDGVVANSGLIHNGHHEMEVYTAASKYVIVAPGEIMIDNHKAWNMGSKTLVVETADQYDDRIDSAIVRVIYGNEGESTVELDILTGTPSQTPTPPALVQETGNLYEYALANIYVRHVPDGGTQNILASDITDQRYVFSMGSGSISEFHEETLYDDEERIYKECKLTVIDGREYRSTNVITNEIEVTLPSNPVSTFMCEIDYTTGSEAVSEMVAGSEEITEFNYQGIKFFQNGTEYRIKCNNMIVTVGARYNILIWWDGMYFWCDCKAVVL